MRSHSDLIARFSNGCEAGSASHMFIEGNVAYSYGRHFPLAVRRDWGAGIRYLMNGDRYSISTSGHQQQCIRALTPNVQVPFSALTAASLTDWARLPRPDLRVVACRSDRCHETCAHCGQDVVYVHGETGEGKPGYVHADRSTPLCPEADGKISSHHVLGAVVLEHAGRYFLSSVDANENWRARSYFLCELPEAVASIEEAFDCLIPDEVRRAQEAGIEVRREGDIFVVSTPLCTREIRGATTRRFHLFDTAHVATEARVNGAVYVRGMLRHLPQQRRPQHATLRLGTSWWVAYKNTAIASWNTIGNID